MITTVMLVSCTGFFPRLSLLLCVLRKSHAMRNREILGALLRASRKRLGEHGSIFSSEQARWQAHRAVSMIAGDIITTTLKVEDRMPKPQRGEALPNREITRGAVPDTPSACSISTCTRSPTKGWIEKLVDAIKASPGALRSLSLGLIKPPTREMHSQDWSSTTYPDEVNIDKRIDDLEVITGYKFSNRGLAAQALTHPSIKDYPNYQRLEFVGDRVLGIVAAVYLYRKYPSEDEGHLTRRYVSVVQNKSLEKVAKSIGLEALVWDDLNEGVSDSKKSAILQDVVESTIAAIYLDSGLSSAEKFIFEKLKLGEGEFQDKIERDSKSELQILSQRLGQPIPQYDVMSREGTDNEPVFHVCVYTLGYEATGSGKSKKKAEQHAASSLLKQLENDKDFQRRLDALELKKLLESS